MKRLKYGYFLVSIFCVALLLCISSCRANCNHVYSIHKTVEATCTEEGYNEYKCSKCGDKYKETISAKGHAAGEAPTFDASQVCTACGTVLAGAVDYMPYRNNELAINQYYGYSNNYIIKEIVSQNRDRYMPGTIQYVDKNGASYYLSLSIPIQDFFKHSVSSVSPLTTSDGKTYNTDSGFKLSFSFNLVDKNVTSIHAWEKGLSSEFKNSDPELLKIVGTYQARPAYYNNIYELVDFSNCYIEIAKKAESGYETIKKIESAETWKTILQEGTFEISDDNGMPFYETGTYRILFKYNMTWITNPPSAVYSLDDTGKDRPIYPYGKLNDQYDYFYITVTGERNNILLPSNDETSDQGFFCQLRASMIGQDVPFIESDSTLNFERDSSVVFKVGAKVDMTKTGYYYKQLSILSFNFTLYQYDDMLDTYIEYENYDLKQLISRNTVNGEEIAVDLGKESTPRDKKCKIILSYSFLDETTGEVITEQQSYYYTLEW